MHFPTEKCGFLQKNAAFQGHVAGNRRKSQEGFQGLRIKNAGQLSQDTSEWMTDFLLIHGFFCNKKARFVDSHTHLVITGDSVTHSLHSRE